MLESLRQLARAIARRASAPFRAFAGHPDQLAHPAPGPPAASPADPGAACASLHPDPHDRQAQRIARAMVEALLPVSFPHDDRFELFAATSPAEFVGGDFYDAFFTPAGRLMLVVADASGKGVPAGMLVSALRAVIRDLAMSAADLAPSTLLERANDVLISSGSSGMFVTAVVVSVDPANGAAQFASAGHALPLIIDASGDPVSLDLAAKGRPPQSPVRGGTVLGVVEHLTFELHSSQLRPGDRLILYSDGVTEARRPPAASAPAQFLGDDGLAQLCRVHARLDPEDFCRAVLSDTAEFQRGNLHDDATLLVFARRG